MSGNINEYLSILRTDKDEIFEINKVIEAKRREYEGIINKLKEEITVRRNEMKVLNDTVIPVKLGDLLGEISWLSGVSVGDISASMKFYMTFSSVEEFFQFIDNIKDNDVSYHVEHVLFDLSNSNNDSVIPFEYFSFLSFDLNDIQADGKKLLEHCESSITVCSNGDLKVEFLINKDIMDIICNFRLDALQSNDNISWYPADLFNMALINCAQRGYNSKVDKIRERVRTIN